MFIYYETLSAAHFGEVITVKLHINSNCFLTSVSKLVFFNVSAFLLAFFLNTRDSSQLTMAMAFMLAVLFTSRFTKGYVYGIISAVIGTVCINFFYTYPYGEFNISHPGNFVTAVSMLTVSVVMSAVTSGIVERDILKNKAELESMRSNLLRSVSHDIRTPLTSIIGAADVLRSNSDSLSESDRQELYSEISEEARWMYNMVENLLSVTRLNNSIEPIHKTSELAEEILSVACTKLKKYYPDADIRIALPEHMIFVPADCTLIVQVLINLMENSIRHGKPTGGVNVSAVAKGRYAQFCVSDNGTGIPAHIVDAINSGSGIIAQKTDDSNKYMGIGLTVCNTIVKAHGGYMQAKSGNGLTEVSFYIPVEANEQGA